MSAQPKNTALTYAEIREWAIALGTFTASDLARAMGVDHDTGVRSVNALCRQGMCLNTGDMLDGQHGYEPIITYVPPPPGPSSRPQTPDPVQQAVSQAGRIIVQRGDPVRIRTHRATARALSTPGSAQKHKNRDREYDKQQEAKAERAEKQRQNAKVPQWQKKKAKAKARAGK